MNTGRAVNLLGSSDLAIYVAEALSVPKAILNSSTSSFAAAATASR